MSQKTPPPSLAVCLLFVVCLLLPVSATVGQTVGTTAGALVGAATDATGEALSGVTVTLAGAAVMAARTVVTGFDGQYRFPALPSGEYTLVFSLDGFQTITRQDIYVGLGSTATVDAELGIAALLERVTVNRSPSVIDRQSTAIKTSLTAGELAKLPTSRSMFAILAATPAVQVARIEVGGSTGDSGRPYSAFGTLRANRPMVEGINVAGILAIGLPLDYGSFDEVSVLTAAHGPEWSAPGVHMQFVVKSGGNQYHGALYADYEHRGWQSFNIDENQIRRGAQGGGGLAPRDANRAWGYHDLNADVGGYIVPDRVWWYSSVRDQDVSARQVNFPVKPVQTHLTTYSGKATYRVTRNNTFTAFGQLGKNHQPNRLDPFGPAGGSLSGTTAVNEAADATGEQNASGLIAKAEWNAVVRDNVFFEARVGAFRTRVSQEPNGTAPRFEDIGTQIVRGGNRDWEQALRRDQVFGSVSYFKDGWFGNHQIKLGGEILGMTQDEIWRTSYPGDVLHVLRDGTPLEVYLFGTPSRSESGLWTPAAHAGDSWRVNGRLTLNLGVRFDRFRVFLPEQMHPAGRFTPAEQTFAAVDDLIDWNVFAPRLGGAYDVTGDGRTILKVSYGRYWFGPGPELGFSANPNSNVWWRRHAWSDANGSGVWEPGEERLKPEDGRGGVALESLDPKLDLPFLREVAAGVERELWADVAVRTGVVWRGERQHYMRQDTDRPLEAFSVPVPIPDPGPDGIVGTADDGAAIQGYGLPPALVTTPRAGIVRNVPNSESHYWTWDITATRRFRGRWSLAAGFAHTWNSDHASGYAGQSVRQNTYPLTPADVINARVDGRHEFRTWSAKVHGTYEAPLGVRVTPYLRHQSGQPFGRTFVVPRAVLGYGSVRVLAEPIGTRRMDHITILDLRVEKSFRLGRTRMSGFLDLFNLLNANPEQNINWTSGSSFLRPLDIVAPRIARIGMKLEW